MENKRLNELPVPEAASNDQHSREMLRAWVIDNGLHCSLDVGRAGENEAILWGILLSDIARHVANAVEEAEGTPTEDTLRMIRAHFNAELESPSAGTTGKFV
jgi:hypothetical protein